MGVLGFYCSLKQSGKCIQSTINKFPMYMPHLITAIESMSNLCEAKIGNVYS